MDVIGHRGAAAVAPENTLPGISAALAAGAAAAEVDLRLTVDGALVLIHDAAVDRTTDGSGLVGQMPLRALRELDAGAAFLAKDGTRPFAGRGTGIPTLAEAWDRAAGRMVLEIKGTWGSDEALKTAEALLEFLRSRDASNAVASSFDVRALALLRAGGAAIATGVLTAAGFDAVSNVEAAVEGGHEVCYLPDVVADGAAVEAARGANKRIVAWTVNDAFRIRALRDLGVDGIISDDPAAALSALDHP